MRITVIGATGMVGSRIVAEAAARGHEVTAGSRHAGTSDTPGVHAATLDLADTAAVVRAVEDADATVVSVSPDRTGGSHEPFLAAHRALVAARPAGRLLVVGGAGSLTRDGVPLTRTELVPPQYLTEAETLAEVLDIYRGSEGLDWTMLSPAPVIAPGERSDDYLTGADEPAGMHVTAETFAVAAVDELERPQHRGARFTVADAPAAETDAR